MTRSYILSQAVELVFDLSNRMIAAGEPVKDPTLRFHAADEDEAKAMGALLSFINHAHRFEAGDRRPLELCMRRDGFSYDSFKKIGSIRLRLTNYQAQNENAGWQKLARQYTNAISRFGNWLGKLRIGAPSVAGPTHPLDVNEGKFFAPYASRQDIVNDAMPPHIHYLLDTMHRHHGYLPEIPVSPFKHANGRYSAPPQPNGNGRHHKNGKNGDARRQQAQQEAAEAEARLGEQARQHAQAVAARRINEARIRRPADIAPLAETLAHLKNGISLARRTEAALVVHAAETLAQALDVRDGVTLSATQYDRKTVRYMGKRTDVQRHLADMLLSPANVKKTVHAAEIDTGSGAMNTRQKIEEQKRLEANREFLRQSPLARSFLEKHSTEIPGLLLFVQSALLDDESCVKASREYRNDMRRFGAPIPEMIASVPEFFTDACKGFLTGQLGPPAARGRSGSRPSITRS